MRPVSWLDTKVFIRETNGGCEPRRRRGTEQEIWEDILDAFAVHLDIDFAYPTRRHYHNAAEGKPGTRPKAIYPEEVQSETP